MDRRRRGRNGARALTGTPKTGQYEEDTGLNQTPAEVSITHLLREADVFKRLRELSWSAGGVADVFVVDSHEVRSVEIALGEEPPKFPLEIDGLIAEIRAKGEERSIHPPDGRFMVGVPIWLKVDDNWYMKACVVIYRESIDDGQIESVKTLARVFAAAFNDQITQAYSDIQARAEHEALLRELRSGSELASTLEKIGAGLMVVDRQLRVVWWNDVIRRRYKVGDIKGCLCHKALGSEKRCDPCPALATFETGSIQLGIPTKDAKGAIVQRTSTVPIRDENGEVGQVLVINHEARESPPRGTYELVSYKRLVDASDDFMMVCDSKGNVLAANRKMIDILGRSEEELLGGHGSDIVAKEDNARFHAAVEEARLSRLALVDTVRLTKENGETIPTHFVLAYDEDHDVYGMIFRDISDRLSMEGQLRAQTEELQARNRRVMELMAGRDRFFRNVSHELRTPLTSIIGFAELLLEDTDDPLSDSQKQLMKRVVGNSHKLLAMVSNLLDLSKIEAGRAELSVSRVDLDELISQVVGNLAPLAGGKNLSLEVKRHAALPRVCTDEQKLGQIVVNLVSNAIKFTGQGSVIVSAKADGKSFSISVKDTGIGIAPDEIDAIFSEFYQARGKKNGERGTGLGLTICQKLAGLMSGRITVKSKLGSGSTFTVTLPLVSCGPGQECGS